MVHMMINLLVYLVLPGPGGRGQGRTAAGKCTGHHSIAEVLQADSEIFVGGDHDGGRR